LTFPLVEGVKTDEEDCVRRKELPAFRDKNPAEI
jgi:hypothetical protein